MNTFPRETDELQPAPVAVNGVIVTTGVEYALVADGTRPSTWVAPYVIGADSGVRVVGLAPGYWRVWAKVTDSPEVAVIDCGTFLVT